MALSANQRKNVLGDPIKLIWLSLLLPLVALADWQGRVVGISDGDTIKVITTNKQQVTIRLVEIDAPEKKQAYGQQAKKTLSSLCYKETATVKERGKDKYGRTLARVYCRQLDVNAEMVKRGMAWAFLKYLTDPAIAEFEQEAKAQKIGLWADANPVSPWDFRHPQTTSQPATLMQPPESETFSCSGRNARCKSMKSCAEAKHYLKECGAKNLDRDGDGIPCENLCN